MDLSRFNNGEIILLASFAFGAVVLVLTAVIAVLDPDAAQDDEEEEAKTP